MTNAESDYIGGKAKKDVVDSNLLQTELEKNTEKEEKEDTERRQSRRKME